MILELGNDWPLLETDAEVLVCTVNCVGAMGKGVALAVRGRWPSVYEVYRQLCVVRQVYVGNVNMIETGELFGPRWVACLPTKKHWRDPSHLDYIKKGLPALARELGRVGAGTVAMPRPGCGNGGLLWEDVRPLVEDFAEQLWPWTHVVVHHRT